MTLGEYAQEVVDYLCKKIPGIDPATVIEIAECLTAKTANYAQDEIKENNKNWFDTLKQHDNFYINLIKGKTYGRN